MQSLFGREIHFGDSRRILSIPRNHKETGIWQEGESADDYTLAELFSIIEDKSKSISNAVESLKKLIGDIEE